MSLKHSHLAGDSVCLGPPVWSLTGKEVFGGPGKHPWASLPGSLDPKWKLPSDVQGAVIWIGQLLARGIEES